MSIYSDPEDRYTQSCELERKLDRAFEREPNYGRDRKPVPLNVAGAVKTMYTGDAKSPVMPREQWRPSDELVRTVNVPSEDLDIGSYDPEAA